MARPRGLVLVLLLATLAAAGAFLANLALANLATHRSDPVGRLTPVVTGTKLPTTEPVTTPSTDDAESDDGTGSDRDEDD